MGAFKAALDIGLKAIEIDIRKTSDGKIAVVHDSNLTRLTLGHPTKFSNAVVEDTSWDELSKAELPYANHLLLNFPEGGYINEFLALNLHVLLGQDGEHPYEKELKKDSRMGKLMLFEDFIKWLETTPDDFIAEIEFKSNGIVEKADKIIRQSKAANKCIFFSGEKEYIEEIQSFYKAHKKPEGLKLGANIRFLTDEAKAYIADKDFYEVGLNDTHISKADVDYLKERGIKVFSNLGDYPAWWKTICDLDIDGFKTNYTEQFTKWWNENY
jgi:glycerophosphoryl diester phosphodiesterase